TGRFTRQADSGDKYHATGEPCSLRRLSRRLSILAFFRRNCLADSPASASHRKPMICSSEKRFFTSNLLGLGELDSRSSCYSKAWGVGSIAIPVTRCAQLDGLASPIAWKHLGM